MRDRRNLKRHTVESLGGVCQDIPGGDVVTRGIVNNRVVETENHYTYSQVERMLVPSGVHVRIDNPSTDTEVPVLSYM